MINSIKDKIRERAKLLSTRANYAAKLNAILETVYNDRIDELTEWHKGERHRITFLETFRRLLSRTLLIELCVILYPGDKDNGYGIPDLIDFIERNTCHFSKGKSIFDNRNNCCEFTNSTFMVLKPEIVESTAVTDIQLLKILNDEYETFTTFHSHNLAKIKDIRDKMLAHGDTKMRHREFDIGSVRDCVNWSNSFVSLLLNLVIESGAQHFNDDTREKVNGFVKEKYNLLISEIID